MVRIHLGFLQLLRAVRRIRFHAARDGHRQQGKHIHVVGIEFERLGSRGEHLIRISGGVIGGGQQAIDSADIFAHRKFGDEILADLDLHGRIAALGRQNVLVGGFLRLIDFLRLSRFFCRWRILGWRRRWRRRRRLAVLSAGYARPRKIATVRPSIAAENLKNFAVMIGISSSENNSRRSIERSEWIAFALRRLPRAALAAGSAENNYDLPPDCRSRDGVWYPASIPRCAAVRAESGAPATASAARYSSTARSRFPSTSYILPR